MAKSATVRGKGKKMTGPAATPARIAKDIAKFQKRRERALKRIDQLVEELDGIDAEMNKYLRDIPVLL